MLAKTSGFARNWPLAHAKFASVWLCHLLYQRIFQTKYPRDVSWIVRSMVDDVDLIMLKKVQLWCKEGLLHTSCLLVSCLVTEWPPVACKLYPSGHQSQANCTRVAASRRQILADFIHVACDWRPRGYNLHATGGHMGTIYMQLAATRVHFICDWPPVANLACASSHLRAKPPVFCKYAARIIIWIKKWSRH